MGQAGNVWEWIETPYDGSNSDPYGSRDTRGGAWDNTIDGDASFRLGYYIGPHAEVNLFGLRVASVPEPSTLSFLAIGLGGLALVRRRK